LSVSGGLSTASGSQDWFTNKDVEIEKVLATYRSVVAASDAMRQSADAARQPEDTPETTVDGTTRTPQTPVSADRKINEYGQCEDTLPTTMNPPTRAPQPPVSAGRKINEYSQAELCAVVRWIMSDTLLRTQDQLLTETIATLGFTRRGKRIVDAISRAIGLFNLDRATVPA
jgi:hypothetical protein